MIKDRIQKLSNKAFTFIELMVTLVIIGTLISVGSIRYLNQKDKTYILNIRNDIMMVESVIKEKMDIDSGHMRLWGKETKEIMTTYRDEGILYDRNQKVISKLKENEYKHIPDSFVTKEVLIERPGYFFMESNGAVYYVDDPDIDLPEPLTVESEIVPGLGWTYSDYLYDGHLLLGFSKQGEDKYNNGLRNFVMPDYNFDTNEAVTTVSYRAFRRHELTGEFIAPEVEYIDEEAFRFSLFSGNLIAPKLTHINKNTFRESNFNGFFYAPKIVHIDQDSLRESRFTGDFNAPVIEHIGGGAFRNSQFNGEFYAPNLIYVGNHAFRNSHFTNGSFGGSQ